MADLDITIGVRDDQTMSQYTMPKNGKVTFNNADPVATLKITAKEDKPWPFCEKQNDEVTKGPPITVAPLGKEGAWICKNFTGGEVLYNAQIGTAAVEDPIIIFEKSKFNLNVTTAALGGVLIGAVAALIVMRAMGLRAKRG